MPSPVKPRDDQELAGFVDRLGHLERNDAALGEQVKGLRTDFEGLRHAIERIASELSSGRATNWGTIATWAGVAVTIGVLSFQPLSARVERNQTVLDAQDERVDELRERLAIVSARVDDLREDNRREPRP